MKQKILVIAPVMAESSDIHVFAKSLNFLESDYQLDYIDPLSIINKHLPSVMVSLSTSRDFELRSHEWLVDNETMTEGNPLDNDAYYFAWQQHLKQVLHHYHAFIGFSFGGVILQQCFPLFENKNKRIILFSTPTFADATLNQKLSLVIALCQSNQVQQALDQLYRHVYSPNPLPHLNHSMNNTSLIAKRLINGLQRVLKTNSFNQVSTAAVHHVHFIGEHADLVNHQNVIQPKQGRLITVPDSGMRVLQDNALFCTSLILDELGCQYA